MASTDEMNSRQQIYWNYIKPQLGRVLSQLDRRPYSPTYGCFDRKFWHQKITDFPSASLQQGVETLVWMLRMEESEPAREQLLQWIEAVVLYTGTIQKWDGSFDEWYFNERGWAGPTAYILNSLYEAYRETGDSWREETRRAYFQIIKKAVRCLSNFEEADVLSNHQALAMLALYQSFKATEDSICLDGYEKIKSRFLECCNRSEGWSLEYDGADPGYQTATISFLARLHEIDKDSEFKSLVERHLEFVSHFFFPDGSFCRGLGSRSTSVIFFFGFEYWSGHFELAEAMAIRSLSGLCDGMVLGSHHQEDHYLIYRLPELFKAMFVAKEAPESHVRLPFENENLDKRLPESGYLFRRHKNLYVVVDGRFGGRTIVFDVRKKTLLFQESDLFLTGKTKDDTLTSGHPNAKVSRDGKHMVVETGFVKFRSPTFNPVKFVSFRLFFMVLGFHPRLAKFLKRHIRKVLMFSGSKAEVRLKREFEFSESCVQITSRIHSTSQSWRIYKTRELASRMVPQSNYCMDSSLLNSVIEAQTTWSREISCVE